MSELRLGGGPEFDRIRAIAAALGPRARGLGNDTALLPLGDTLLALSTDLSVEGVHFRREWLTLEEIGWRATAAALSDLAAAAATPLGVLAALTLPGTEPAGSSVALMEGAGAAAAAVGATVLGGDLSSGDALSLAITVVGTVAVPVGRSGARPGDGLWVTGELGGARAALADLLAGRPPEAAARARFAHPEPRIDWGRRLAAGGASAMLDLSDGLAGDAEHLAAASRVALRIELERIPVHPAVQQAAATAGEPAPAFAASGGEDYELLVALPAGVTADPDIQLTRVGEVQAGAGLRLDWQGRPVSLAGYRHFA